MRPAPFVDRFFDYCQTRHIPIDFFSWHLYASDPTRVAEATRAVRQWLDDRGFKDTRSYLTEWSYLPDDDWQPLIPGSNPRDRERAYQRLGSAEGAAFAAAALARLQDEKLDVATYYTGDTAFFGLFTRAGEARKPFYVFLQMQALMQTPLRLSVRGAPAASPGFPAAAALAGTDNDRHAVTLLATHLSSAEASVQLGFEHLPWPATFELRLIDAQHDAEVISSGALEETNSISVHVTGPAVLIARLARK